MKSLGFGLEKKKEIHGSQFDTRRRLHRTLVVVEVPHVDKFYILECPSICGQRVLYLGWHDYNSYRLWTYLLCYSRLYCTIATRLRMNYVLRPLVAIIDGAAERFGRSKA